MKSNQIYIIDFDSTFTQVEALDELAKISLKDNPKQLEVSKKIEEITQLAMAGDLNFMQSLDQRINFPLKEM